MCSFFWDKDDTLENAFIKQIKAFVKIYSQIQHFTNKLKMILLGNSADFVLDVQHDNHSVQDMEDAFT